MTYTQYSQNRYSGAYYYYKCSKCGTVNQGMVLVGASASYNDKGILFSKKALARREQSAIESADKSLEKQKEKVINKINQKNYRYLDLNMSCRNCGNREKWADPGFVLPNWLDWLRAIFIIPLFPPIILLTWYLFDAYSGINGYLGVGLWAFATACLFFIPHLVYRKKYKQIETDIIGLPEENLPHAFSGNEDQAFATAKEYYLNHNLSTGEAFDELKEYRSSRHPAAAMIAQIFRNTKIKR